jgi:hypothetical protein
MKLKSLLVALALLLVAGGVWLAVGTEKEDQSAQPAESAIVESSDDAVAEVTISDDGRTVTYEGQGGYTALELLQAGTDVTTQDSDFGSFVTGINGVEADSAQNYWAFYVGDEYADEGAGTYQATDGEQIEWRLEDLE